MTAPLSYQESFDNSGLQAGLPSMEVGRVLVCLDVTEEIVDEAIERGCNMILSHHPLIFKPLKQISGLSYQQRCCIKAIKNDIAIYSAHTSLDNAVGGVNYKIASLLGVQVDGFLQGGEECGSGVIGHLEAPMESEEFLRSVKAKFGIEALRCSEFEGRRISKVAICGGAGAFLLGDAIAQGADCFVCGEFHYHDYFENCGVILCECGHYQSEQFTCCLLRDLVQASCPEVEVHITEINTNPIKYL